MDLIDQLSKIINSNYSYVQTQLAKEDLARIEKIREIALTADTIKDFQKQALFIGWTKGDFRTHEISEPLKRLNALIFEYEIKGATPQLEDDIIAVWKEFIAFRAKTIVHCL